MSRARNIKPGFFRNEDLAELPFEFRILFQGLWCLADREGRLEDRAKRIKADVFPYDDVDVDAGLLALADAGFIQRYHANGTQYIQVLAFTKHQNPHCKEAASTIPAPCNSGASIENSGTSRADSLIPDSLIPDSGLSKPEAPPVPAPGKSKRKSDTLLTEWLGSLPEGEDAIPADGAVFEYAGQIGMPAEYVALAWAWFKAEMTRRKTRQANWRGHFFNAVKGNWPKYWFIDDAGGFGLTTAGKQAQRAAQ